MTMNQFFWMALIVGIGGFIGAVLRFSVHTAVPADRFPWGTLVVNIIGSFILGYMFFAFAFDGSLSNEWRAFLGIGILGAFTTMSTFSVETMALFGDNEVPKAMTNILLNVGGSLGAVWLASVFVQYFTNASG